MLYNMDGHAPSLLPDGYRWKLVWNDEFDGTELDRSKWDYRLCMMGKRHRTWTEDGVTLDGHSNAVFSIYEKDGEICSSQLETGHNFMDMPPDGEDCFKGSLRWQIGRFREHKFLHRYGYYECRCRLQQKPGWWSAFWMQSPIIGCCPDPKKAGVESDIMESFAPGTVSAHSTHYNGYALDHKAETVGHGMKVDGSRFHTFGMLWTKEGYTFYVDGIEDGRQDKVVSESESFILISTEVKGYRAVQMAPTEEAKAAVGDTFLVDHVRVFDIVE